MIYNFTVFQQKVDDHLFWVAKSTQLKGCVGQGDSCDEAIRELEENEREWLDTAAEYNIEVPQADVKGELSYSGKFALRMSPYLHEQVDQFAKSQNVSINHLINEAVSYYIGAHSKIAKNYRATVHAAEELLRTKESKTNWRSAGARTPRSGFSNLSVS